MGRINSKYIYKTTPQCRPEAIVAGDKYRFTVLTDRLIRMEYSESGVFEDRATQTVINRVTDTPEFRVRESSGTLKISTAGMELTYHGGTFTKNSLSAKFTGSGRYEWHFGENEFNLKGTARTLDTVDGECELEDGIMSRCAMTVLDDSRSLILADDGWVDVRMDGAVDMYLFAYREDYKGALRDFCSITGRMPMIPRYALGNWWSRFYKYTQEEYEQLMQRFECERIPFSVAVIDMDWHYTDIAPEYGSGWTGFSWNRELFPDHCAMLKSLEERGMKVTLNLHPAEGIAAHEAAYKAMAEGMGIDPESGETVAFDIADPKFVENYFDKLIHPLEREGVAFWWMDWQQGNTTKVPGLDPLWMLNHYHYTDMLCHGVRPMIFSRYAGPGSQRYPIGFSGDTVATWKSLDFQPYFTNAASNIGYGRWSHDIGGHMYGYRDDEMMVRWVQLGVFSPIMRLHSMCNDFQSKEPWQYNRLAEEIIDGFLRLRHRLIPYLYTMDHRAYEKSLPIVEPLYYECDDDEAYTVNRNEYFFGSEMIVSPITKKSDPVTCMGSVKTYLPNGDWYDFFSGRHYTGRRTYKMYRCQDTLPVLVKAGGIVPLDGDGPRSRTDAPKHLEVHVFPGADGRFVMYEDDGETNAYMDGVCVKTEFSLSFGGKLRFVIGAPEGNGDLMIRDRKYTIVFRKLCDTKDISVTENGREKEFESYCRDGSLYVELRSVNGETVIEAAARIAENTVSEDVFEILLRAQWTNALKETVYNKLAAAKSAAVFLSELTALDIDEELRGAIEEVVCAE